MKRKMFLAIVSILAIIVAIATKKLLGPIESLVFTGAVIFLFIWQLHNKKQELGVLFSLYEMFYVLISFSFVPLLYLMQTWIFIRDIFVWDTISFAYMLLFAVLTLINIWKDGTYLWNPFTTGKLIEKLNIIYLGIIAFPLIGIITHWGSQHIWIVTAFVLPGLIAHTLIYKRMDRNNQYEEIDGAIAVCTAVIAVLVPLISTIIQFWGWTVWLIGGGIIVLCILFVINTVICRHKNIRKRKEKEAADEKRQEQYRREEKELHNAKLEKRSECLDLLRAGQNADWEHIHKLWNNDEVPEKVLFTHPIFYQRSDEKKEFRFNRNVVIALVESWNHYYDTSMDDQKIVRLKALVDSIWNELESCKTYKGFDPLKKIFSERLNDKISKKFMC